MAGIYDGPFDEVNSVLRARSAVLWPGLLPAAPSSGNIDTTTWRCLQFIRYFFVFFAFLNILILFNSFNAKFKAWNKDLKVQE